MELNLNRVPPPELTQQAEENKVEEPIATTDQNTIVLPETPPQSQATEEQKPDLFFDSFNKRFGTAYKADDEIKGLFDAPKRISEYEAKLKDFETLKAEADKRQKEIERLEGLNDPLKFFSSPETYVAEQLRIKYPDKDPVLLQEIATTDVDKMEDFDVLAKSMRMFVRNLPEGGRYIKDVLYKKYGIDVDTPLSDIDGATKTQIALDAATERNRINDLKKSIDLPKVITKEERAKAEADFSAKRMQALAPLREQYTKFEKYSDGQGLDFDVPKEFQAKLGDIFDGMFIEAGHEPDEKTIAAAEDLKIAWFLKENFSKIKEVIVKQAQTDLQAKIDAESHNDSPPNTTTATDQNTNQELPGIGKLVNTLRGK